MTNTERSGEVTLFALEKTKQQMNHEVNLTMFREHLSEMLHFYCCFFDFFFVAKVMLKLVTYPVFSPTPLTA